MASDVGPISRRVLTRLLWCVATLTLSAGCGLVIKDPIAAMGSPKLPADGMLSRADAIEDVSAFVALLDRVHPEPYRFRARNVLDAASIQEIDTMPASLSKTDLCLRISRIAATIDDGHTEMLCQRLLARAWQAAATATPAATQPVRMFPPYMRLDVQQHLIVGGPHDAPGVETGDRLLRVNGHDADALLTEWSREISHDTEAGRRAWIAQTFRMQLGLHGIDAPFRVTVSAPGGANRDVLIKGEPINYLFGDWPPPPPSPASPLAASAASTPAPSRPAASATSPPQKQPVTLETPFFKYQVFPPDVAYMNFTSILGGLDTEAEFRTAVNRMFKRVASDKPRVLIIDIRENGGGEDHAAGELLRHITEKPFRLLASTQVKRSQEARDFGTSIIRIPFRWMGLQYLSSDGRQYYRGEVGTLAPPDERAVKAYPRADPFFDGPVCVLTGPRTFSAATEFAEAVKTYGLATLVGEDTGGQPNSFGNPMPFALPRSGLPVYIATARGIRANGNLTDFRSVTPDIVVHTTQTDIQKGIDPVIARAMNCPARSIR